MKKLLIRADDLGYSEGTNYGIEKSVKSGLVRNVGVIVNMPHSVHDLNFYEAKKFVLVFTQISVLEDLSLIPSSFQVLSMKMAFSRILKSIELLKMNSLI